MERLLRIIRKSENRKALSWVGGGLIILAAGMWVIIEHFFPVETPSRAVETPSVKSQGGIASGRDTHVRGDVSFGSGVQTPASGEGAE